MKDSHAAIISRETFDIVHQEFRNRKELKCGKGHGKYFGQYPFSGIIICGECGETYRRYQQYTKNNKYDIWICKRYENTGKIDCSAKPIREKSLEGAFVKALNDITNNKVKDIRRFAECNCWRIERLV